MFQSGRLQYWSILRESKLIGMHLSCLSVASAPSRQGRGAGQSGMPGGKCGDSSSGRRLTARIAGPHRLTAEHNSPITHHIWRRLSQQKKSSRAINSIQADWSTERHVTLSSVGKDWKKRLRVFLRGDVLLRFVRGGETRLRLVGPVSTSPRRSLHTPS